MQIYALSSMNTLGESPGLVVMGGDSHSEGRGCRIPVPYTGWTFFHINLLKICIDVCLKRPKLNEKRPGWPIFLKKVSTRQIATNGALNFCHFIEPAFTTKRFYGIVLPLKILKAKCKLLRNQSNERFFVKNSGRKSFQVI